MDNRNFKFHGKKNVGVFHFKGQQFQYFNHSYNGVGINERTIEIPIASYYLNKYNGKDILEVGNVMSHYLTADVGRDIVDKYEKDGAVINADIVDFCPQKKYDLILSVSTIEHIGNTEEEKPDPKKGILAIEKLHEMLKPGGLMLCTFPIGVNYNLDYAIRDGIIKFDELYCFARESTDVNHWHFSNFETAFGAETKGVQMPIKAIDNEYYEIGIYFFLLIGLKYE